MTSTPASPAAPHKAKPIRNGICVPSKAWPMTSPISAPPIVPATPWTDEAVPAIAAMLVIASVAKLEVVKANAIIVSPISVTNSHSGSSKTRAMAAWTHGDRGEGDDPGVADAAQAEAPDDAAVGPARQRHRRGDRGEHQPDPLLGVIGVEHDLLDRGDVGGEPAEDRGQRERIAQRQAVARRLARGAQDAPCVERAAIFGMQRFGQADEAPQPHHCAIAREQQEDRAPRPDEQDRLAEARRQHGHQHEHHEDEAHDLGHRLAVEQVADHRDDEDARHGGGHAHRDAPGDQQVEARRHPAQQGEAGVERDADGEDRLAPEAVGERPPAGSARRRSRACRRPPPAGGDCPRRRRGRCRSRGARGSWRRSQRR